NRSGDTGQRDKTPDHLLQEEPSARGSLRLLAVGVSNYKNLKDRALKVAHTDALKIADAFKGHSRDLFDEGDCAVLTNEGATRKGILKALAALGKKAKQHDLVVVTLSGHGDVFARTEEFYFLPQDYDEEDEASKVYWADLKRHLGSLPCRVLLVVDTCHSGAITKELRGPGARKRDLERQVQGIRRPGGSRGVVVFAACM